MKSILRLSLAALAAALSVVASPAGAVQAAAPAYPASVTHTRLILDPTDRGYSGSMQFTVTWRGKQPNFNLNVEVTEPIAAAWRDIDPLVPCVFNYGEDNRRTVFCLLDGFQPGQSRTYSMSFRALTPAQTGPMIAGGGRISVLDGNVGQVSKVHNFSAILRGTNGKIKNPVPYIQDTQTDITFTAGKSVTLVRQADGTFLGRLPMTVQWSGDAPNNEAWADMALPSGWFAAGTEPSANLPCFTGCTVPGGALFDGDVRTFDMLIEAPEDTPVGTSGTTTARASAFWGFNELTDVTPEDNVATFSYSVVG